MKDNQYQRFLEYVAIIYAIEFILPIAIYLWNAPNTPFTNYFSESIGFDVTNRHFSFVALITCLGIPFILTNRFRKLSAWYKVPSYVFSAFSILVYTVPFGVYILQTGGNWFSAFLLINIFLSFVVIALCLYRK